MQPPAAERLGGRRERAVLSARGPSGEAQGGARRLGERALEERRVEQ